MIPAFYTDAYKELAASGEMSLAAWVKGRLQGESFPAFSASLRVHDGSFKYASLPRAVEGIEIAASAASEGGSLDNTVLDVERFTLSLAGNTLSATVHAATPLSDPYLRATADGTLDLGALREVYPLPETMKLAGKVTADVSLQGHLSAMEKGAYERIAARGRIALEGMEAQVAGMPALSIAAAEATVSPRTLALERLSLRAGRSDVEAHGELTGYLGYIMRGEKLTGRLQVKSRLLDLNELLGSGAASDPAAAASDDPAAQAADTAAMKAPAIPRNLDLALATAADRILFQQMVLDDFAGNLSLRDGAVRLDKLDMKAFGGRIAASGGYSTASDPASPALNLSLRIDGASFARTFAELDLVRRMVPLFEKTGGDFSASLDLTTRLDEAMQPRYNTLQATGELSSKNIELQRIKVFDELAAALKYDKLRDIQARDIRIPFTIADGRLATAPFELKVGGVAIDLSGSTGLDQSIDYTARITLPQATGAGFAGAVPVTIRGTFSSPKIGIGVEEMAKEAAKKAASQAIGKLTGGGEPGEAFDRQAEKMRAEAKEAGEKLVAAAKQSGEKLVEKAKNPIARIAAQKSADALVRKAEEQAQKLESEAEERIAALEAKLRAKQ